MALPNGYGDRVSDLHRQNSGSSDESFAFYNPPLRQNSSRLSNTGSSTLSDARASLQRRFTTSTVSSIPGLSPIGQQRRQAAEPPASDLSYSLNHKVQLLEKKQAEYEFLKKKKLQFQQEMDMMEMQERQDEEELQRLRNEVGHHPGAGHQSEPTTPPELREGGFPSALSRPNRFSTSSIISPPGIQSRSSRTNSQTTSPPNERQLAYQALTSSNVASSNYTIERNGNGNEATFHDEVLDDNHRPAASRNRNSMPVTRRDLGARNGILDLASAFGHVNTPAFLFGEDFEKSRESEGADTAKAVTSFLQMHTNDEQFPILIRKNDERVAQRTTSSSSLDLATPHQSETDFTFDGWPSFGNPKRASTNLPLLSSRERMQSTGESPPHGFPHPSNSGQATPTKSAPSNRHSMGARIGAFPDSKHHSFGMPSGSSEVARPVAAPKLQPSFSTSSVPTVNSVGNSNGSIAQAQNNPTAEERLHNHNVSIGRIPPGAVNSNSARQSKDFSSAEKVTEDRYNALQNLQSPQHNSTAAVYNPVNTVGSMSEPTNSRTNAGVSSSAYSNPTFYGGYNVHSSQQPSMQMLSGALGGMSLINQGQWNPQMYSQQYGGYGPFPQIGAPRFADSQQRVIQQRRTQHSEEGQRYANVALEQLQGEIYGLCKDQHGCRYLQRKLEERKPENVQMIFAETHEHMYELMTDPFGNYLCQKLLEHADDDQRTALINNAAPNMVKIALSQHGTRALQKMIEYVSKPEQIQTVIRALKDQVVPMIQDLNGNHVIQKCLNRLSSEDAQFIFDAVAGNCVVVGTHRHGCCVIQRCIDHASGNQKAQLVAAITNASFPLVQDPFGNYVLQYILDQNEPSFSEPLCRTFLGNITMLSKQKFSSNVIEKCIRIAETDTKHLMIEELLGTHDFERLADDPFANYVVQTAFDYANPEDEARLAESIRPVLPRMRHKPYGRRFQNRIAERDKRLGLNTSGSVTPIDMASPESLPTSSGGLGPMNHRQSFGQETHFHQSPQNGALSGIGSPQYGAQMLHAGNGFNMNQPARFPSQNMPNMNQYQVPNQAQHPFPGYSSQLPHHGTSYQ